MLGVMVVLVFGVGDVGGGGGGVWVEMEVLRVCGVW